MNEEVDQSVWRRKDMLNARMSALKAASINHEGKEYSREYLLKEADDYYAWIVQDQEWKNDNTVVCDKSNSNSSIIPTPTVEQAKWLKAIEEKHGFTKEQVWTKCKSFPSDKTSAVEIVRKMKN